MRQAKDDPEGAEWDAGAENVLKVRVLLLERTFKALERDIKELQKVVMGLVFEVGHKAENYIGAKDELDAFRKAGL